MKFVPEGLMSVQNFISNKDSSRSAGSKSQTFPEGIYSFLPISIFHPLTAIPQNMQTGTLNFFTFYVYIAIAH